MTVTSNIDAEREGRALRAAERSLRSGALDLLAAADVLDSTSRQGWRDEAEKIARRAQALADRIEVER